MSYWDIALLSSDSDFMQRTRASVSTQGVDDPVTWSNDHAWQMAGMPSFGDKYAYAIATGVPNPGRDEAVISDQDILSAVQSLLASP